jgi:serine/threonine-protein kinase
MLVQKAALDRGSRLGKYEIHGRLSVGGMAELYLASLTGQGGFKKFVALKRVLPTVAEDETFLKMFLDEARITASLTHASIAQVFELTEDPETREPFIAMEFIAGQNVEQIIGRAKAQRLAIPLGFTTRLAYEVLLALHFAHSFVDPVSGKPMPVIHRDINPRNVMVTYSGGTKIVDFGIAKARGRLGQTQVGYVKGTLQYMAPEQVTLKDIDGRADLFAASILFHELLTGRRLIDESSNAANMNRIMQGDFPSPREVNPSLPVELVDVVMKGLQSDREKRWKSGRDYARAIDRAFGEQFDDEQMGEFMGRLFADKIGVTRALLSSSTQASVADLRLMTMVGDDEAAGPVPLGGQENAPTTGHRPTLPERATEQNLEPVVSLPEITPVDQPSPPVPSVPDITPVDQPAPPRKRTAQDMPTTIGRKPTAEQAASTPRRKTVDGPPRTRSRSDANVKPAPNLDPKSNRFTFTLGVVVLAIAFLFALGFLVWGRGDDPETARPLEAPAPRLRGSGR